MAHRVTISTSVAITNILDAIDRRNAVMLFLTEGACQERHPCAAVEHPLQKLDWANMEHRPSVYVASSQIISYNAERHLFLCKPDWLQKLNMISIAKRPQKIQPALFNVHAFDKTLASNLSTDEAREALTKRDDNIFLNAPAGYGKSVFVKHVIKPALL